jgi:hypothetical protein
MKPWPATLAAVALAWAALMGRGVLAALTVLVATGILMTVAALTQDPIVVRSERPRPPRSRDRS